MRNLLDLAPAGPLEEGGPVIVITIVSIIALLIVAVILYRMYKK